jgi:iron(III) transport system substrate-binding protein
MITVLIRIAIYVIYLTLFLGVCVMKKVVPSVLRSLFAVTAVAATLSPAIAADEVNLYTTREPQLIQPLLDSFTKETGVTVNTIFVKDGLIERVKAEGARSPADVLMTVDIGNLVDLVDQGVTQPIDSATLNNSIPANLRGADGQWYALSLRDRVIYAAKDLNVGPLTYESLSDPKWEGKICIRSGQHPYNTALFAALIAHNGAAETEQWLTGVKNNLARQATGGDRDVARDILGGICDIGLANAYYAGHMKTAEPGSDNRQWGDAIEVIRPTFERTGGTFVNISGAAVAKFAPNRDNAISLLEFLVSDQAQTLYANANFEYPVKAGVATNAVVESFGEFKIDPMPVAEVATYRKQASEMVDTVGFNN